MEILTSRKAVAAIVIALFAVLVAVIVFSGNSNKKEEEKVVVSLVLTGAADDGGWNQSHYEALKLLEEEMNLRLICRENVPETDDSIVAVIDELAQEGVSVICAAGWGYGKSILSVNEKYPDIMFLHCAGTEESGNVSCFFGRMYQARYLTGIAAAMKSESKQLGYVAAMKTDEVIRGINAFTLGARSVDPEITVHVAWTDSWENEELEKQLAGQLIEEYGCDVLTYHQNTASVCEAADSRGVSCIGYHHENEARFPDTYLTTAEWHWAEFYRRRIQECIQGSVSGKNYWDGINEGAVGISPLTENNAEGTAAAIDATLKRFSDGDWDVFFGPVYDSEGNLRVAEGESMTDEQMLNGFDWLVMGAESIN